ncbi:MAG: TonB-dependent receptor [Bacteroidales bacterium]
MKNLVVSHGNIKLSYQFLRKMKLTIFLLLTSVLSCISAETYSQITKLNVVENNSTLLSVLRTIENQSEFNFFYNEKVDIDRSVSVDMTDKTVYEILDKVLANSTVKYKVIGRQIALYDKNEMEPFLPEVDQERNISGKVTDKSGAPLPGVSIFVKGTTTGTTTDINGNFSLVLPSDAKILTFSFVGMEPQEISIGTLTQINVTMAESAIGLEEVVVVGYGTQKKTSVTGALTTMKSEDVKNIVVPNLSNALAGRMSGVFVNQSSGAPGYAATIRVRAINTWKSTGLDPLYVIDGIISDKRMFDALDYSMVDNITVLKDAASGAIYGARAANGVILVTTKTGAEGKFQLNYNYSYSFDKPTKLPAFVGMKDEVRLNNYVRESRGMTPLYDAEEVAYFNDHDPGLAWYTLGYSDPVLQKHSLTATGGTEKVKYFLGGSYFDQTAFIKNADYNKYNFRSNLAVNFTKNLTGIFNVSYSQGTKKRFVMAEDLIGFDVNPDFGNLWARLLSYLPYIPPKTSDGKFINPGWIGNPLAWIEEGGTNTRTERNIDLLMGLTYKVSLVDGLSVSGKFSPNYEGTTMKQYELKTTLYNVVKKGSNSRIFTDSVIGTIKSPYPTQERLAKIQEATSSYQLNFSASYVKKFGKHNVDAILVYEQSEGNYDYFYGVREGFPLLQNNQFWATSSSRTNSYVDGTEREYGRASYIGRMSYNYDEKYFVNVTTRRDGSMLFAPGLRWGTFPSFSAGWVASKEDFFNVKFIDFLKLRGSWGLAGNDAVGGWKWSESFSVVNGDYLFGTTAQPRVMYDGIVNKELTWEKTSELNIGLDSRLFKGFLFNAEYYYRHNYDILDTRIASSPVSFGGSLPPVNYGIVDAHGYELELGYISNLGEVAYGVKGNFAYATNKVVLQDVAQNAQSVDNPNGRSTDYVRMLVSTGIIRTQAELDAIPASYTIYGLKPLLGSLNYEDVSGVAGVPDGKIDDYDRQILKGKHFVNPYTFGLNLNANWKGFGVDVFLQGVTGISKLNNSLAQDMRESAEGQARFAAFWLDSWSPDNIHAAYPKPVLWGETIDYIPSTFWLKNGSFLRLGYVNLTYTLPKSICEKIRISDVTFILLGTNLFTLTGYDYNDPNVGGMHSYPTMKSFTMGANVTF